LKTIIVQVDSWGEDRPYTIGALSVPDSVTTEDVCNAYDRFYTEYDTDNPPNSDSEFLDYVEREYQWRSLDCPEIMVIER